MSIVSPAHSRVFPKSSIIAFEPIPTAAEKFKSVFSRDTSVRLIQAAIGPNETDVEMHISMSNDSSSLLPITKLQSDIFPGTQESHLETVKVAPLDAFISEEELLGNNLLKIDVQGFELETLKGCESLLGRFCAVYVECSFVELYEGQALAYEVIDWLHDRGFQLTRIGMLTFSKRGISIQGDFLFLRN